MKTAFVKLLRKQEKIIQEGKQQLYLIVLINFFERLCAHMRIACSVNVYRKVSHTHIKNLHTHTHRRTHTHTYIRPLRVGVHGAIVIVTENGHDDPSSKL